MNLTKGTNLELSERQCTPLGLEVFSWCEDVIEQFTLISGEKKRYIYVFEKPLPEGIKVL